MIRPVDIHQDADTTTPAPAYQIRRRLRALQAQGYTTTWIANHLNVRPTDITTWSESPTGGRGDRISPTIGQKIRELYTWVDTHTGGKILPTGPTPEAVDGRWHPPAAWEDIDDLGEHPTHPAARVEKEARRKKIPVPSELRDHLVCMVEDATVREAMFRDRYRERCTDRFVSLPSVASSLGIPEGALRSVCKGQRSSLPAEDMDRVLIRLGIAA